jgi:hypothetical protein
VLEQQGRLELDADANEQVAIRDHLERMHEHRRHRPHRRTRERQRLRHHAERRGPAIGAGRMYVDGILCELDEARRTRSSRTCRAPDPLEPADGRTDLVYLDVWQRHVSAVEDPDAARSGAGRARHDDAHPDGLAGARRSRTSVTSRRARRRGSPPATQRCPPHERAVATPDPETPCDIVVAGGYRGVENRLYRVEIHEGAGGIGTATWKWSRDNGSVAFAIEEFLDPGDRIRLRSLGRDRYLALRQDDWVEILDDASELGLEPGFMAQ